MSFFADNALSPTAFFVYGVILFTAGLRRWSSRGRFAGVVSMLLGLTAASVPSVVPIPVALTNAALMKLPASSLLPMPVARFGVNAIGDAPVSWWWRQNGLCATADVGSCNNAADGNSFVAVYPGNTADAREWGVVFDGVTDSSTAFIAAAASGLSITCPANKTAVAAGIVFGAATVFDCNMSTITAPASAVGKWLVKRTGALQVTRNLNLADASGYTMVSTTLTATATPGTTNLQVANSANAAVGMAVSVTLDCGLHWTSLVTAVPDGSHITILDAIPNCATSFTVNAGGTGYAANDPVVALGGSGLNAPLTIKAAVSGGALNGGTIEAPGLYTTVPSNPVALQDTGSIGAYSASVNVTWAGAGSGKAVRAAWGVLTTAGATQGTVSKIEISGAPVGILYDKGGASSSDGENLSDWQINGPTIAGLVKDVDVHDMRVGPGNIWGTLGSCGAGLYMNGENTATITGGNRFNGVYALQCDIGHLNQAGQLDNFTDNAVDTNKYYGAVWNDVINTYAAGYYAGFSGPDNGYGGGLHIGNNSTNDGIAVLQAGNNAFDLNVDGTDSVFLHGMVGNAGAGHRLTGNGAGIFSGQQTIAYNYGTVSASGTPTYLGIGQSATEGNVLWRNALYGSTITQIYVDADSAPGNGHTYTAVLRRGVANTATSCSFSGGSSFGCVMTLPMQATAGGTSVDSFDIALTADTNLSAKFTVTVMQQP